ncbi:MAG: ion transporter [Planctomycetota bacterium]
MPEGPYPHLAEPSEDRPLTRRERIYEIIFEADTPAGKFFDVALIIAILASVLVVVLSTLPDLGAWAHAFFAAEWAFTLLFTAEYITRLAVAKRPLRYAFSFFGIIDLLSILPAFIGLLVPGGERLLVVRTLRVLRVFRVLKLARYLTEARALQMAVYESRHKIAVFLTTVLIINLICSAIMHVVEGPTNDPFSTMPEAMYWSIITMTTVGYGDVTPITVLGKMTTAILVLLGYSLIIVPTGILSAEITARRGPQPAVSTRTCTNCTAEGHDPDAKFCKACGTEL